MQTVDSSEVTAIPNHWRTPVIWIAVVLTWLPIAALCENLQLGLTHQPPGTPRWLLVVGGALTIPPLTMLSSTIQVRLQRVARQRGIQHIKLLTVSVHAALAAAFTLVVIDGRGWLGALAVPGAIWQSWLLVFLATRRPGQRSVRSTSGATTFADLMAMSERGQAREALALLSRTVVPPDGQASLVAVRAMCTYRSGLFEEAAGLQWRLAQLFPDEAPGCAVVAADARLSAALRDSRTVTRDELDESAAAIFSPDLPEGYAKLSSYAHTRALLTLASGDPETAMHAGVAVTADRSIAPADRALVAAMIAIAAARAGQPDVAGFWASTVPGWCPLRPAVERELGIRSLDVGGSSDEDADCVFAD